MIVTLTTDFGARDGYVAAMKGAMLCVDPEVRMVDVSHEVPAQDVMEAAYVLRQVVPHYPAGTVHLVVVDPGVGTERRGIAAALATPHGEQLFVGPDNGLLALLSDEGSILRVVELDRPEAWGRAVPSDTFHGRDVFGPVATRLAMGATLGQVGTTVEAHTPMHWPLPRIDEQGIDGMVLHVDGFGNCVTNVTADDLAGADGRAFKCYAGSAMIKHHVRTYDETDAGDPVTLIGSAGYLEVAVNRGHASRLLSIERGDAVKLLFEAAPRPDPAPLALASGHL